MSQVQVSCHTPLALSFPSCMSIQCNRKALPWPTKTTRQDAVKTTLPFNVCHPLFSAMVWSTGRVHAFSFRAPRPFFYQWRLREDLWNDRQW